MLRLVERPVAIAVARVAPAAIVSFHPLTTEIAVRAAGRGAGRVPALTVVTDLVTPHVSWRHDAADRVIVASAAAGRRCHRDGTLSDRCRQIGVPVGRQFWGGPLPGAERGRLRRSLGLDERRFLVVVTGGGEGSGGMARRVAALIKGSDGPDVVAICGRNRRLRDRLVRLVRPSSPNGLRNRWRLRSTPRLIVKGFVDNMADWLHCADVVVTKAGPGTIAEATCCGAALVITSHVPGQEKGNTELVVGAGAASYAPGVADLLREIHRLRADPAALEAMRAASTRLGRPAATRQIAALVADAAVPGLVSVPAAGPASDRASDPASSRRPM